MKQFFQDSNQSTDTEVVSAEIPGELWSAIEDIAKKNKDVFIPHLSQVDSSNSPLSSLVVDLTGFMKYRLNEHTPCIAMRVLDEYVSEAMDLGYNYLHLTM